MNGSQTQKTMACVLSHTHHKRRASMAGRTCPSMQLAGLWAAASKASGLVKVSVSDNGAVTDRLTCARLACARLTCALLTRARLTCALLACALLTCALLTCALLTCVHGLLHDQASLKMDLPGETGRQGKAVSM